MKNLLKSVVISIIIIFLSFHVALSGTEYDVKCTDEKCNFKAKLLLGSWLMGGNILSVYCKKCNSFYYFPMIKNNENNTNENNIIKIPKPIGEIWNFIDKTKIKLYKCPICSNICNEIKSSNEIKYCPKCEKNTLEVKVSAWTD